jgi:hypothetical protein
MYSLKISVLLVILTVPKSNAQIKLEESVSEKKDGYSWSWCGKNQIKQTNNYVVEVCYGQQKIDDMIFQAIQFKTNGGEIHRLNGSRWMRLKEKNCEGLVKIYSSEKKPLSVLVKECRDKKTNVIRLEGQTGYTGEFSVSK